MKSRGFSSGVNNMSQPSEAIAVAGKIAEVAERIAKVLDKIRFLKKEGQGIYIKVPERICQYDVIVKVRDIGLFSKEIHFPLPEVDRLIGTCMPSLRSLHNAIHKTSSGFVLQAFSEHVPYGTDFVLMQFQYKIPSSTFISNLVEKTLAAEPVEYNDRDEYWIHAQLKFPQILQKAYSHLRLQDVNISVNVAVDNEIKTAVPKSVIRGLRTIRRLLSESDRSKAHVYLMQHLQSRRRLGMSVYDVIYQINSLFASERFKSFVHVTPPFRYFDSKLGTDFYDFPGQVLPKAMTVVSRTDLSLETPAVEGKVVYKKRDLHGELEKVFK